MSTRFTVLIAALTLGGCSSDVRPGTEKPRPPPAEAVRVGTTRGGAVVLSRDERIAVVANRASGVVSIVELDADAPVAQIVRKVTPVDIDGFIGTGHASEPWAGVIGADGNTAYVITRATRQVYRIVDLRGQPHIDGFVSVGSEPTSIVISPSGQRVFVANFGEGTISVVTTDKLTESKISLNEALANTGLLGTVAPRPALAHPRALALTDDGDESDDGEVLYATEFFSQPIPGVDEPSDPSDLIPDRNRQGLVYPVPLGHVTRVGTPIPIQPTFTGFFDAPTLTLPDDQWRTTNCVPNQLYSAVADAGQLFVTAMCASPAGPLGPMANGSPIANFKTVVHPAIFVVDTETNQEVPQRAVVLTQGLAQAYESDGERKQRMPLIPDDIDIVPDPKHGELRKLCISAMGADAVFCAAYDSTGKAIAFGEPGRRFIDLHAQNFRSSRRPTGLALSRKAEVPFGLAANDGTTDLSVFDLESSTVEDVQPLAARVQRAVDVTNSDANHGRTLFSTGLTVWSLQGQAWSSCESCHPDGLSDGLTWFFSRGPRRTLSTAGTYVGDQRRIMLWTGNIDEVHDVEAITRTVSGGVGGMLWDYPPDFPSPEFRRILYQGESSVPPEQNSKPSSRRRDNLNGSIAALINDGLCAPEDDHCDSTPSHDWNDIDAFIRTVRSPARPTGLDSDDVIAGESLFVRGNCSKCHSGPAWTLSRVFYTPGEENNGALPFTKPTETTSAMLGSLRSSRYNVPKELLALNPPGASGSATYRLMPDGMEPVNALYPPSGSAGDQINCVLRDVGTFPVQTAGSSNTLGVVPQGAPVVRELRQDMKTLALGVTGFNIPSLLGLSTGAPYFHAGNARTLEELFDGTFAPHYQALDKSFEPTPKDVRALVAYLLTIDDDLRVQPTPSPEVYDLCGQREFP